MYRILSIDGGGMHGYANVVILQRLLKACPDLIEKVDLIAGTSIGGIVGLGIAAGHDLDAIEDNFIKGIPLAFLTNPARLLAFYAGFTPKYDNRKFKAFLRGVYGLKTLGELQKKVIIPAYSLDDESATNRRWRGKFFHNFEGPDSDKDERVLDVAMATSAVPVFFPSYGKYIDGALVANNPAFSAVAQTQDERCEMKRPALDEISVLSLGTIRDVFIPDRTLQWGYFSWVKPILNIITERDTLVVNYLTNIFLGKHYHRVEPVINGPMDEFEELENIGKIGYNYPIEKTVEWLKEYW